MRTGGIFNIRVGQSVAGGTGDTRAIVYRIRAGADCIAHEDVRAVKELICTKQHNRRKRRFFFAIIIETTTSTVVFVRD